MPSAPKILNDQTPDNLYHTLITTYRPTRPLFLLLEENKQSIVVSLSTTSEMAAIYCWLLVLFFEAIRCRSKHKGDENGSRFAAC